MLADCYACQHHTADWTGILVLFAFLFDFKGRLVPKCGILIFTSSVFPDNCWGPLGFIYLSFIF